MVFIKALNDEGWKHKFLETGEELECHATISGIVKE